MATKSTQNSIFEPSPKISRPGIHAKSKTSSLKSSKKYKKLYKGQGR